MALTDAIKTLQDFDVTVPRKSGHHAKEAELLKIMHGPLQSVNRHLFDEHDYYFSKYHEAIKYNKTKKECDKYLRLTVNNFLRVLYTIKEDKTTH